MKMKKGLKSVLSVVLVAMMLVTVMAPMASAISFDSTALVSGAYLTSKTDYTVAPGITETHVTTNNASGSDQIKGYALEVDLNNPTVSVVSSYKDFDPSKGWGFQKVRDQAYAAEKKLGVNVVAGVNGDFFNMQTGAPTGTFVMNGTAYNVNDNWNYFAILNDGTPIIGSGKLDTTNVKECIGGPSVLVKDGKLTSDAINNGYGTAKQPRTAIGITADKKIVLFVADGRQAPTSCGQTFLELAEAMLALGCVDVLSLDGGGSSTFISQHEGKEELVCRNSPSDGAERTVSTALLVCSSAKPSGVFDHASLAPNNEVYTPNSTVQFTAAGVDSSGYSVELPKDGKFVLVDDSFGTITSGGLFTSNGKTGTVVVNYVSDGEVCGSVSIEVQIPDELYVSNTEQAVGPGVTTDFGIVAKYKDRDVTMNGNDIEWSIVDSSTGNDLNNVAGTFNGLYFTGAEKNAYNATVKATLVSDKSISLTLTIFIGSKQVMIYDFEYTTDAQEAANNSSLKYIPSYSIPVCGANWMTANSYGRSDLANKLRKDGYPLYMWPNAALENDTVNAEIVSSKDGEPVRFGNKSLRISFDFSSFNYSSNGNFYLRSTDTLYSFEGSPSAIGVWVYAPEGTTGYMLYLNCANKVDAATGSWNGSTYTTGEKITWTGWKYLELDLTGTRLAGNSVGGSYAPFGEGDGCGVFWISYQPANMGHVSADTIYLDNMTVIYGANTSDTINPTVNYIGDLQNSIVDGETVFASNTNTFKATYSDVEDKYMSGIDDSATKMYIDGVDVTDKCYINTGDDEIYFYDAVLSDGVHCIEIEVSDVFGNKTTEMRYFTIDSSLQTPDNSGDSDNSGNLEDSKNVGVAIAPVDGAPVLGKEYKLAITSDSSEKIESIDVKVKVLSDYTSYWRDITVEPSANYVLVGEAVYNSNNDTISFKVVKKAGATEENESGTIATIITKVPSDVPEGLQVTHRVSKGEITLDTESDDKYVSGFSGKVTETTTSPFIITTDVMVVGSDGGYIYVTDDKGVVASDVSVFTSDNKLIGVTDADGKLFTNKFVSSVAKFSIYAKQGELLSFVYTNQSFNAGGDSTGIPTNIKLNASEDSSIQQNISWMSSPLTGSGNAVVKYAEKADYEANGEVAFVEFAGKSNVNTTAAGGDVATNYAVRFNSAVLTGLKPATEYVYVVGDGVNMSAVKTFETSRKGAAVNFFVMGDTQSSDTTNVDAIFNQLASSGVNYNFGIQTGDAVDNAGSYSYWDGIGKVFSGDFISKVDMIHVLGNHEYTGDTNGINAATYFNLPGTTDEAPLAYSFEYGNVYVACFTYTNTANYKLAAKWLVEDAANSNATWKVLAMHQPPYFTNVGANSNSMTEVITAAVDEAGIDFVFSGHDHTYARTVPVKNGVADEDGAVYFICAATSAEKGYQVTAIPNIHEIATDEYNSIYLTVSTTDTSFDIKVYNYVDGEHILFDSYSANKDITCTEAGLHDYIYADGWLTCEVCGYTTPVDGYTGFANDKNTGKLMYFIGGNMQTGWVSLDNDHYYFDKNGLSFSGKLTLGGHTYTFGEDGKMTKGSFEKNSDNSYSYYINGQKQRGWFEIDGDWYYFSRTNGFKTLKGEKSVNGMTYTFSNSGKLIKGAWNKTNQGTCYYWGPYPVTGLQVIDGYTYYFDSADTYMLVNESVEIDGDVYAFGSDGRFAHMGDHVDDNNDGACDYCEAGKITKSFIQRIIDFFEQIKTFFQKLFK